jgi:hypothetical protein
MRSRSSASASSADTAHSQLLLQLADTVAQALSLGNEQLTHAVDEALQFDRHCVEHAGRDAREQPAFHRTVQGGHPVQQP